MKQLSGQTFDNFIVGQGNRAAHAAAIEVARDPGRRYNPLFLYGGTGTGKSHLLAAIAREVALNDPSVSEHYMSYQTFSGRIRGAGVTISGEAIRQFLSKVDLFLLDDVRNDEMWFEVQREMTDWIDRFIREERQIVFASDRSPLELDPCDEKFLSRIQAGLVVSIAPADRTVKRRLISRLLEAEGIECFDDALDSLAGIPVGDFRELSGIMNRLIVSLEAEKASLTRAWVTSTLQQLIKAGEIRKFRIETAVREKPRSVKEEWFETEEPGEPQGVERNAGEGLSIAQKDVQSKEEASSDIGLGRVDEEAVSVQTLQGEGDGADAGMEEDRKPLEIDESDGFSMEWDREIDRLLDEL